MSGIFNPVTPVDLPPNVNLMIDGAAVAGISPKGDTIGVVGESVGQAGVYGTSTSGDGVDGGSDSGVGVRGTSSSQSGVVGQSTNACGVWAQGGKDGIRAHGGDNGVYGQTSNDNASGMYGINLGKGPGVKAASQYGASLSAAGYNGNPAAEFDGNVKSTGDVTASTLTASGMLSAGSITTKGDVIAGSITTSGDVTAHDILLAGGDVAEEFRVAEEAEPGTVMVIGEDGALSQCTMGYDKKVAGVVSGAGELKPGVVLGRRAGERSGAPLAMVGKVFCKVDATYAPIRVGDLLTTSPTPGHAMRVSDQAQAFGSVIGKALRRLDSGSDLLPILVALQ